MHTGAFPGDPAVQTLLVTCIFLPRDSVAGCGHCPSYVAEVLGLLSCVGLGQSIVTEGHLSEVHTARRCVSGSAVLAVHAVPPLSAGSVTSRDLGRICPGQDATQQHHWCSCAVAGRSEGVTPSQNTSCRGEDRGQFVTSEVSQGDGVQGRKRSARVDRPP